MNRHGQFFNPLNFPLIGKAYFALNKDQRVFYIDAKAIRPRHIVFLRKNSESSQNLQIRVISWVKKQPEAFMATE